jgi:hypothetical protein
MIKKGDIVRIKPEWQDKGDDKYTFIATEDQTEDNPWITIRAEIGWVINPTYCVDIEWLDLNKEVAR